MNNEFNGYKKEKNQKQIDVDFENKTTETNSITANIKDNKGTVNQSISQNITKVDDNSHKRWAVGIISVFVFLMAAAFSIYLFAPLYKINKNDFEIYPIFEETKSISEIGAENIVGTKSFSDFNCHRYSSNNINLSKSSKFSRHKVDAVSYVIVGYINGQRTELFNNTLNDEFRMNFTTDYHYYDFNNLDIEFTITYSNGAKNTVIFTKVDVDQDF